jgi:hypothetical protein
MSSSNSSSPGIVSDVAAVLHSLAATSAASAAGGMAFDEVAEHLKPLQQVSSANVPLRKDQCGAHDCCMHCRV